tara:strand:+ start:4442 stop:4798 length:357 start_codon:yes stop_codon:yes gene_type:complete
LNIILPAALEAIATRADNTLKLTFGTPELSPTQCGELFKYRRKEVLLMLSTGGITKEQQKTIDTATHELKEINKKSHSQRLRDVLFIMYEQERSPYTFPEYYAARMDALIEQIRERLE